MRCADEWYVLLRRTAYTWQSFVNQQVQMMSAFKNAMSKLAVLGQNTQDLIDYSEVVPAPKPPVGKPASFPTSTNFDDIEPACATEMFPALTTDGQSLIACIYHQ